MLVRPARFRGRAAAVGSHRDDALRRADLDMVESRARRRGGEQRRGRLQESSEEREARKTAAHAAL
jgi:hypothetical protein